VNVILAQGKLEMVIAVMLAFVASTLPGALGVVSTPNSARWIARRVKATARPRRQRRLIVPGALLWARPASMRFAIFMWTQPFCSSCATCHNWL
jgi:hypothetical protein